jgi:hypothetical protein
MKLDKRELEGVPISIINKMLYYQVEQGNDEDVTIFQNRINASKKYGGFNWYLTAEGHSFWAKILLGRNYDHYETQYSSSFKNTLRINIIPRLEKLYNDELEFIEYLREINADSKIILKSNEMALHYKMRLGEYKEYLNEIENE